MTRRATSRAKSWRRHLGIAVLLAAAVAASADSTAPAGRVPRPALDAAQGEKCVADTAYMRRNHMELLLHQRDATVHAGVRPRDTTLERCIACHASRVTGSVVGGNRNFCQGCHSYAAVKLDCFECHASRPEAASAAASRGNLAGAAR